jgi:hypothetical protein
LSKLMAAVQIPGTHQFIIFQRQVGDVEGFQTTRTNWYMKQLKRCHRDEKLSPRSLSLCCAISSPLLSISAAGEAKGRMKSVEF